jgi:hypothetical protein
MQKSFDIQSDDTIAWARSQAAKQVRKIDATTEKAIAMIIQEATEKGYGYQWIAESLTKSFAFSESRAILIASHEIGEAYLNGKDAQFKRYENAFGTKGYKKWVAHKDDRTTA